MSKKNSTLLILLLIILSPTLTYADSRATIEKANKAYQAGFYENAARLYEQVLEQGVVSSELYYNLGNAHYKTNEISKAILNYERALKLDPKNEDIQYNLRIANNQIVDKIDQLPLLFYIKWWQSLKQLYSPDGWVTIFFIFFTSFFALAVLFLLSTSIKLRKTLFPVGIILLFLVVLSFMISRQTYKEASGHQEAIVFVPSLPVKSSPEESGIDLFVIHEGLKVEIIDHLSGWNEIKIANGSKGWVRSETIEKI